MTDPNKREDPVAPEQQAAAKAPAEAPKTAETVVAGATDSASRVMTILKLEGIQDPKDRKIVGDAAAFLEGTAEKSVADVRKHAESVGEVLAGYMMTGAEAPGIVEEVSDRLEHVLRQLHLRAAKDELGKDAPDLFVILDAMRNAQSNASMMSAVVKQELEGMRKQISERKLTHPTYESMLKAAALLEMTTPHISDKNTAKLVKTSIAALRSGDQKYFEHVKIAQLWKQLTEDAKKAAPEAAGIVINAANDVFALTGTKAE